MKTKIAISVFLVVVVLTGLAILSFNQDNTEITGNSVKGIERKQVSVEGIEQYKDDLRQITCYCGCEHTDLYDCYEEDMLADCGLCMKEYGTYLDMKDKKTIQEISDYIDNRWGR